MHPYKTDVPVLLIFWARPEIFSKVFDQVKAARPSKLFLYQDGPREGHLDDQEKILKCREVAEDIDWECELHKFYQPNNVGCDPSEFIAQKWAFSIVDRCIVLEDDDVPALSFFPFCAELLERYKNDERISLICGMNHLGVSVGNPYDYTFSITGGIWGWASWKRFIDKWDDNYGFLDDKYILGLLGKLPSHGCRHETFIRTAIKHRRTGRAYYETILESSRLLNSGLNIIPTKNMISNIGLGVDAVHAWASLDFYPKGIRGVFDMERHEIEFPLKHPKHVVCDMNHVDGVFRIMGYGHRYVNLYRWLECRLLAIKRLFRS